MIWKICGPSWLEVVKNLEFSFGHGLFKLSVMHTNRNDKQDIRFGMEFIGKIKAGDLILTSIHVEIVF